MKAVKKWRSIFLVGMVLVLLLVSACGGAGNSGGAENAAEQGGADGAGGEPVELTMMNYYSTAEPPKPDNEAITKLEELTNTKLNITWVPKSAYQDKVVASVSASSNLPQILLVREDRNAVIIQAARAGMFWDVGPYLDEFPNLKSLDKTRFNNMSIDGKIYGLYRWRPIARDGLIIRKDWLDNLGLEVPKTIDELVDVLYAFKNDDPDGNGKDDTYGFSNANGGAVLGIFMGLMGVTNQWGEVDGKLMPNFMTKEYMDTLKLMRQMYADNVFNNDFPLVEDRTLLVNQGKAGMYVGVYDDLTTRFVDLAKLDPNAELIPIPNVSGPSGKVTVNAGSGYNSVFLFPKTSVKTEEELKQILAFFDKTGNEDVQNLFHWGIQDKHFKVEDGKAEYIDQNKYTEEIYANLYDLIVFTDGNHAYPDKNTQEYENLIQENEKYAVADPTLSLISKTEMEKSTMLDQVISDAETKFIMGDIDEAGFQQVVEQWKSNGGDQIIEEFTEQYNANKAAK